VKLPFKSALLFFAAFTVTLAFAVYQRHTGPTYPVSGESLLAGKAVKYKLVRSQDVGKPAEIRIEAYDDSVLGTLAFRRYPTADPFTAVEMKREGKFLVASMPTQPPAGKLEYQVRLRSGSSELHIPEKPVVIRFKGSVPAIVLVPHIILIFLGLLFSAKSALDALTNLDPWRDSFHAFAFLFIGGLVLGPVVQKFAFGAFWTGWPFGGDWTDNKTAVAVLAWFFALYAMRKNDKMKKWAPLIAFAATLIVFGIPHSFRGSQLDWSKIPAAQ